MSMIISKIADTFGFKERALHESALSKIWKYSHDSTIGIITAYKKGYTTKENEKQCARLWSTLRDSPFGLVYLTGHHIEQGNPIFERSYLLFSNKHDNGQLKGLLRKQGQRFEQDCVIYREYGKEAVLMGTSYTAWPGFRNEVPLGTWKTSKMADYYSKMKCYRSFMFESVTTPKTLIQIMLEDMAANRESRVSFVPKINKRFSFSIE